MTATPLVAYIMTAYPVQSQTFLQREVMGVAAAGSGDALATVPFAINQPGAADVTTADQRAEQARTEYIKTKNPLTIGGAVLWAVATRPRAFARVLAQALRRGGTDVRAGLWQLFYVTEAAIVARRSQTLGVTHFHAQFGMVPATLAGYASRLTGVAWSYTIHGFHDFVNEDQTRLAEKTAEAQFVVCVSDYTRAQLLRLARPEDWGKVHTVRCGIDLADFAPRPAHDPGTPARALIVGRLSAEKGHLVLLEAVAALHARGIEVVTEIVGSGPHEAAIADAAARLGIADLVELRGPLPSSEVRRRLEAADLFCLPSFAEGIPVSIMEALAVGVPVVTTYVGGIPEVVETGVSGYCVPAGRADLLADAMAALLADPAHYRSIVHEGRRRVEALHDAAAANHAMRDLFLRHHQARSG
jgi:glycosyltransferase involved in cell wall biosynthesis